MSFVEPDRQRIVELELIVTHLQHDLESLNAALLEQQKEIVFLRSVVSRIDDRMKRGTGGEEQFDPAAEKPPHY